MVPFIDLKEQNRKLRGEILEVVTTVVDNSSFVLGQQVEAFEREFAALHGPDVTAVGVNSGTSALHLALIAVGVGEGDEVITTPYTFLATAEAIRYVRARPVFVDIDPTSHTLDVSRLEAAITPRTKAILPVHIFGQMTDMDPLLRIARRERLPVIEDAAQAHVAEYNGQKAGTLGDIGCFSFYPSKNLGACGEAGLVLTQQPELEAKLRMLRNWGQREKDRHEIPGYNYRMDGIQAAILRVKLKRLASWTEQRRQHARLYGEFLKEGSGLRLPQEVGGRRHVYHLFPVRASRRNTARAYLATAGVGTGIHYTTPVHLLHCWSHLGHCEGDFPQAEALAKEELSLPMYAELTTDQIKQVADVVNAFFGKPMKA